MNATPPGVKVGGHRPSIGFQFVAVPAQLLRAGDLSFGAVVLLGVVAEAARQNRSGLCKLANATLAERIGRSESEVGRYLLELESAGLARREFGRSRHVRLGVRVTWAEPVPDVPGTPSVQVPRLQEPGSRPSGIAVPDVPGPIQNPRQNPSQTGSFLPLGEEPGEVPDGPTAARYLRAMVQAGRKGTHQACPPADFADLRKAEVPAAVDRFGTNSESMPRPSQGDVRREVERMAVGVFIDARRAAWGPSPGRRRMTPAEIERQLAEVRRKYGGRAAPPKA